MRRQFRIIVGISLLFAGTGCRCTDCDKAYANWFWEDAAGTKAYFDSYRHVLLVRVDRDVWVDGGKHRFSEHHYQGTVERVYRGDWKPEEPIEFVHWLDQSTPTRTNRCVGERLVLMTQEHTNSEIGLDTGEVLRYERDFKNVLRCAFPEVERE